MAIQTHLIMILMAGTIMRITHMIQMLGVLMEEIREVVIVAGEMAEAGVVESNSPTRWNLMLATRRSTR